MSKKPLIVYFSLNSENTKRFVEKLPFDSLRIPVGRNEKPLIVNQDFVLIMPTYGSGQSEKAVPKQVAKFFREEQHKKHCVGVIGGGNRGFGEQHYVLGARIIAQLLHVPLLHTFEVLGMERDVKESIYQINKLWGIEPQLENKKKEIS